MKKQIYISGKMSGILSNITMKFGKHEKDLLTQGANPLWRFNICSFQENWDAANKKCFAALLTCEEIHMLPDWEECRAATLEHQIAKAINIQIIYLNK